MVIRMVRKSGYMRWNGDMVYVSEALVGGPAGLDQLDDRHFVLYYSTMPLAILDDAKRRLLPKKEASAMLDRFQAEHSR